MHEDRVILESVLANNRNAILDLHNVVNGVADGPHDLNADLSRESSRAGDHHRELSESTGVDIPPIPDVLPLSATTIASQQAAEAEMEREAMLKRTFSKRGVRLGIHMSILDLSAHEASSNLQKKWLQQAHLRQQLGHAQPRDRRGLTALPELSRISEVDTAAGSTVNLNESPTQPQPTVVDTKEEIDTPRPLSKVPENTPVGGHWQPEGNLSIEQPKSSVSARLRRVMSKMSIGNLRTPSKSAQTLEKQDGTFAAVKCKVNDEDGFDTPSCSTPGTPSTGKSKARFDQEKRNGKTLFEMLKQKFDRSPAKKLCVDYGFEYGNS